MYASQPVSEDVLDQCGLDAAGVPLVALRGTIELVTGTSFADRLAGMTDLHARVSIVRQGDKGDDQRGSVHPVRWTGSPGCGESSSSGGPCRAGAEPVRDLIGLRDGEVP